MFFYSEAFKNCFGKGAPIWNANAVRNLSDIWNKIKADNASLRLMDKVELGVSGLNDFTLTYPSYYRGVDDVDDNLQKVEAELRNALGENITVIPQFSDDSDGQL